MDKSRFILPISNLLTESNINTQLLINWVNSGAADNYKIDWNLIKNKNIEEIKKLINSYKVYLPNNDPRKILNKYPNHFEIIYETDDYLYFLLKSHTGAVIVNSFALGGAGAKWCLGYKDQPKWWYEYLKNYYLPFIAYNKKTFGSMTNQKLLIVFHIDKNTKVYKKIEGFGQDNYPRDVPKVHDSFLQLVSDRLKNKGFNAFGVFPDNYTSL